jgi:hypothetical protein
MGRTYRRGESFLLARHGRRSAVRLQVRSGCAVFSVGLVVAIWAITTIRRAGRRVETNKPTTMERVNSIDFRLSRPIWSVVKWPCSLQRVPPECSPQSRRPRQFRSSSPLAVIPSSSEPPVASWRRAANESARETKLLLGRPRMGKGISLFTCVSGAIHHLTAMTTAAAVCGHLRSIQVLAAFKKARAKPQK